MSPRHGMRLLAVLLTASAALAPYAAHAERVVTEDEAADVVRIELGEGDELENSVITPAPDVTTVDITRTVVDHRAARVRVVVHYRDVTPADFRIASVKLRTPDRTYEVFVVRSRGDGTSTAFAVSGPRSGECLGLRAAFDRPADRLTVHVPRACLRDPRWVQVGVGAAVPDGGGPRDVESEPVLVDDAHLTGTIREDTVGLGPKVHHD